MTICLASNLKPPEPLEEGKTYSWDYIKDILKSNEFYNKDAERLMCIGEEKWRKINYEGVSKYGKHYVRNEISPDNFNYVIYFET